MALLESNAAAQRAQGSEVLLLSPAELKARFPSMYVNDLGGGVLPPRDSWCDPNGLLQGFKRKCASMGVTFVHDRVVGLHTRRAGLTHARLASGADVRAHAFVNAAGAWAGEVSALANVPLPVAPLKRYEHYFTCGNPIERLPYVKDLSRLAFRSEGVGFSDGLVDGSATRGFDFDIYHDYFEKVVWPAVAHRFPHLNPRNVIAPGRGFTSSASLMATPSAARHQSKISTLSPASLATA
jgi:FAD-dependent oxidoreductase domain-containing protein 1